MESRRRWSTLATAAVASAAVLAVSITGGGAHAAQQPQQEQAATAAKSMGKKDQAVTLITGDRVVLQGGDPARVRIDRGEGREKVAFRTQRSGGKLLVIPMDVSSEVTSGRLDQRLFDVTGLIKAG